MEHWIEMHAHSNLSDGNFDPVKVLEIARDEGVSHLSLNDHNRVILAEEYEQWSAAVPEVELIPGCEMSCSYDPEEERLEKPEELHVNLLFYTPGGCPNLARLTARNQKNDRSIQVNRILKNMRELCGVDLGCDYDDLCRKYPDAGHVGRMVIARECVAQGYAKDIDEAFRRWLNQETGIAYVKSDFRYVSLEEVIEAAKLDGALPSLCHLNYYTGLSKAQKENLVRYFAHLLGDAPGALECDYHRYGPEMRSWLHALAEENGLIANCGSDFHSHEDVMEKFPVKILNELREAHQWYYG